MALASKPTLAVFFFLLYSLSTVIRPTCANCYWPNGTDRNVAANASYPGSADEFYAPCNPDAKASMCCAIGPARQSYPDTCASNGLCLSPDGTTWWRESCTDQTWSDPACVKLYVNGTFDGTQNSGNDIPMTMCPDGSYCAGTGGAALPCCNNNQGYFILANLTVTQQNPNTTASASSSLTTSTSMALTATSSVASPAATASFTPSPPSGGLSTGAKAGIGIGATVAGLALFGLLFWLAKLRRSNAQGQHSVQAPNVASPSPPQSDPRKEAQPAATYEVDGTQGPRSGPHFMDPVEMEQPMTEIPRK